jgi:hypothetical protein
MELRKISVVLLALLLAAMAMVPMVSAAGASDPYYKDILIGKMGNFSSDIAKNAALNNAESALWDAKLSKVTDDAEAPLTKYLHPDGPVIGWGYDMYGTMDVQILKDRKVSQSDLEKIYDIIKKAGEKNGIKDIPCKFISMGLMKPDSRSDYIRPAYAGLKISANDGTWGTSGFRATRNGNVGFVTAGHIAPPNSNIYQPDNSYAALGTVSKIGSTLSDSAFIGYNSYTTNVYVDSGWPIAFSSYDNSPTVGSTVYKSGAATGTTSAQVAFINKAKNTYLNKYLPNQAYAHYQSAPGDSGAAVYTWDNFDPVLVGLHMGQADPGYGVFSSISAVKSDLGITPAL